MIAIEGDETTLYDFLSLMQAGDARPPKGLRENHPSTPLVVAAHNRLAQIQAPAYRDYRRQRALAQKPAAPLLDRAGPAGRKTVGLPDGRSHLSLF